jgi:hypothetical protein
MIVVFSFQKSNINSAVRGRMKPRRGNAPAMLIGPLFPTRPMAGDLPVVPDASVADSEFAPAAYSDHYRTRP